MCVRFHWIFPVEFGNDGFRKRSIGRDIKNLYVSVILAAFCISQSADSQTPSDIQVLQATYGAGTQQIDVTTKVRSLVQGGQTTVRVGNHLFGKDPNFGQTKTLSVVFTSNGVQYRTD